jgi:hypothetical protein
MQPVMRNSDFKPCRASQIVKLMSTNIKTKSVASECISFLTLDFLLPPQPCVFDKVDMQPRPRLQSPSTEFRASLLQSMPKAL